MNSIKLAIVVPSKPKPSLSALLESLKGQPYDQLIVELRGGTPAQARNMGFEGIYEDITHVLFLDDDVIVAPNFIEEGIKAIQESGVDFGQSRVVGSQENSEDKFIGTAMWFSEEAFNLVKGFDEEYPFFNEDLDMFLRCEQAGLRYGFFSKSIAIHSGLGAFEKLVGSNERLKLKFPKKYESLKKEIR